MVDHKVLNITLNSDFWTKLGAIAGVLSAAATFTAAFVALMPVRLRNKREKEVFNIAVQVDIFPDGVFRVRNIFDEPIYVYKISQKLITNEDIFLGSLISASTLDKILNKIKKECVKSKDYKDLLYEDKVIPPKGYFVLASTLTHLPSGYASKKIWAVSTIIKWKDSLKKNERSSTFIRRISWEYEPRDRWVEVI